MNLRVKSFVMLSLLAIALQAFPQSTRAEGFANPETESIGEWVENYQYCYTLNHDGSENIVDCPNELDLGVETQPT